MWKLKSCWLKAKVTTPFVEKAKGKPWHLQLTYIYPQPDNEGNRLHFLHWNNSARETGSGLENWLSTNCVEVCGAVPETGIQSCKLSAFLPEGQSQKGGGVVILCTAGDDTVSYSFGSERCKFTCSMWCPDWLSKCTLWHTIFQNW